jgi:hypothetical protein
MRHPEPSLFGFVGTARFGEPVRARTLIVNNTTIIKQTTEIAEIKHESRNLAGSGSQKVVVNRGPGVEVIQKATGRVFTPVSIREAALRTSLPAAFKHGPSGPARGQAKTEAVAGDKPEPRGTEGRGDDRFGQPSDRQSERGTPFGGSRSGGGGERRHGH